MFFLFSLIFYKASLILILIINIIDFKIPNLILIMIVIPALDLRIQFIPFLMMNCLFYAYIVFYYTINFLGIKIRNELFNTSRFYMIENTIDRQIESYDINKY